MRYFIIAIIIISFTSCRVFRSSEMFTTDKNFEFSKFKESEKEYKIQPFDKLDVKIFTNDGYKLINIGSSDNIFRNQNNILYNVNYDGFIKLPSLGKISISGYTIEEAENLLEKEYKTLYQNPFVIINVTNRRVIVFSGGSDNGKVIELKNENYTLIEALAESGGISNTSKSYRIKLIRGDLNNPEIYLFNIAKIEDMQKANFRLETNDIIYVETRNRYASILLAEITPYLSLFTTGLLIYGLFAN